MNFALDSSFALTWVLADEASDQTDRALDSLGTGSKAFVPALWRWEISNALLSAERQKRAAHAEIAGHLHYLQSLPIEVDEACLEQAWNATHWLAQRHKLTSYDAAYLELSIRRGLPLASQDDRLREAAKAEGVRLL